MAIVAPTSSSTVIVKNSSDEGGCIAKKGRGKVFFRVLGMKQVWFSLLMFKDILK